MKKLFGENILPNCSYCEYFNMENGISYCKKSKTMKKNRCRSFKYDPLMRVPKSKSFHTEYTASDFKI